MCKDFSLSITYINPVLAKVPMTMIGKVLIILATTSHIGRIPQISEGNGCLLVSTFSHYEFMNLLDSEIAGFFRFF